MDFIKYAMDKSGGQVRVVKVSKSKRLSRKSLSKLDRENSAHVRVNKAMENKSLIYAANKFAC